MYICVCIYKYIYFYTHKLRRSVETVCFSIYNLQLGSRVIPVLPPVTVVSLETAVVGILFLPEDLGMVHLVKHNLTQVVSRPNSCPHILMCQYYNLSCHTCAYNMSVCRHCNVTTGLARASLVCFKHHLPVQLYLAWLVGWLVHELPIFFLTGTAKATLGSVLAPVFSISGIPTITTLKL